MASTDAERARRSRKHRKGDHSLCDPSRCDGASRVTSQQSKPANHRGLGARGWRLWRDEAGDSLTGGRRELLEEACRTVDRLDRLDAILAGDPGEWMRLRVSDDGAEVTVTLDKALAEARQQATALKQLLVEFRNRAAAKPESGGSVIDQLAARRAARHANPAS